MEYSYSFILESYKISDTELNVKVESFNTDDGTAYKNIFFINDKKIGSACVCSYKHKNDFLFNVEVKKDLRGKGYGTKIVKYMIDNYKVRHLIVGKDNIIAQNLYKKFNFKITDEVDSKFIRMER